MTNIDQSTIAAQMIAALSVVEPDLDTSIGTTIRNILDVEAEQISQAYLDNDIAEYQYDVDSLSGSDLDAFCANFGFVRFVAQPSTGIATFTQVASATQLPNVTIPSGTTLATASGVNFQTVTTYTLISILNQNNSVDIPIQATVGGTATNVAAGSIVNFLTPLSGINSVTNNLATSGGTDAESDAAFRTRFKATLFRGLTGTAQSFLGAAEDNSAVSAANVMGAVTTHSEQITLTGTNPVIGASVVNDASYVFPTNQFMAQDLSVSTSEVEAGSFTLGTAIVSGTAISQVAAQSPVTLPPGTILTLGAQVAYVSAQVTNSTTIPINTGGASPGSLTPTSAFAIGYSVDWVYNTGGFLTPGVDFVINTAALLANPTSGPTLAATPTTGGTLTAGTYYYACAYANAYGTTIPYSSAAVTVATGNQVTLTPPSMPAGYPPASTLYIYVYRGTANTAGNLIAVFPATQATYVDAGAPVMGPPVTYASATNTTGSQISVTGISSNCPAGTYQVQFNYIPASSRNSYPNVLNCVDIYTNGIDDESAAQVVPFYVGPMVASGLDISPTTTFGLASGLTSGTAYTQVTSLSALTLPAGTFLYFGGTVGPAIVSAAVTNSTVIPIVSYTPAATIASSILVYADALRINGVSSSALYVGNFQHPDGTLPKLGSKFIPMAYSPVTTLPSTLTSPSGAAGTYDLGTDYFILNQTNTAGMSNQSLAGIEWLTGRVWGAGFTTNTGSPTNVGQPAPRTEDSSFHDVPLSIYQTIQQWRLISHDVMVHQAYPIYLDFSFVVVFASGVTASLVQSQINAAVAALIAGVNFNQTLEASQVLAAVLGVTGVSNARYALSGDSAGGYGIQSVTSSGSVVESFVNSLNQVGDIHFNNVTYPVFNQTFIKAVAQNAFVTGTALYQPV